MLETLEDRSVPAGLVTALSASDTFISMTEAFVGEGRIGSAAAPQGNFTFELDISKMTSGPFAPGETGDYAWSEDVGEPFVLQYDAAARTAALTMTRTGKFVIYRNVSWANTDEDALVIRVASYKPGASLRLDTLKLTTPTLGTQDVLAPDGVTPAVVQAAGSAGKELLSLRGVDLQQNFTLTGVSHWQFENSGPDMPKNSQLAFQIKAGTWLNRLPVLEGATPMDRGDREGSTITLVMPTAPDPDLDELTYSATNLPSGLSIDSGTGVITGTIGFDAAQVNDGRYDVTVTVADGHGGTAVTSFTWWVEDQNRLFRPDDQLQREGTAVSLQLEVIDGAGGPLTYGANNLPAGLMIDPNTGAITGTLATGGAQTTTQPVVLMVSGDGVTDTRTVSWTVVRGAQPQVFFAVNNTLRPEDDIAFVEPFAALPVTITLFDSRPGLHHVELSVTPSERSTLEEYDFELSDGESATVWLSALQVSAMEDDVFLQAKVDGQAAGQQPVTNAIIDIPKHIRAANTPTGMKDRITVRLPTEFKIVLAPVLTVKQVTLGVVGNSAQNGEAKFVGANGQLYDATRNFPHGAGKIKLQGTQQTAPTADGRGGNAGKLFLNAVVNTDMKNDKEITRSQGFSVAAIPQAVTMSGAEPIAGELIGTKYAWGVLYNTSATSDSGNAADLDRVKIAESIELKSSDGAARAFLRNLETSELEFDSIAKFNKALDQIHFRMTGTDRANAARKIQMLHQLDGNGSGRILQHFKFSDERTGVPASADAALVPESGFQMDFTLELSDGKYLLHVQKVPVAIDGKTAKGTMPMVDQKKFTVEIK